MKQPSIAIIGAGIAGLACARRLLDPRLDIRLFDKGRSPGGRLATRRVELPLGKVSFDHGAQYITARDETFARLMESCGAAGAAALWEFDDSPGLAGPPSAPLAPRWVGVPGMSALARHLAQGLAIETSVRITSIRAGASGWSLAADPATPGDDSRGPFDAVVVALPAEQAAPLLEQVAPKLAGEAAAALTGPCWAGLFAFDRRFDAPFSARRFGANAPLAWVAREASKPGRAAAAEAWVVHASPAWSRAHIDLTPEKAAGELWRMLLELAPEAPEPMWRQAHRWRYASVEIPASSLFAWDPVLSLGICGDWRGGPRVEAAWLSGNGLGAELRTAFELGELGSVRA